MDRDSLLDSKIRVPHPRPGLVSRPRLMRRMEEGLELGRQLTLLSAPAGFGKTTLLSEWALCAGRPVAWISLEESENDPAQFLRYLAESLRQSVEGIGSTVLLLLQSPQPTAPQNLVISLLNDLSFAPPFLLVLDDYHLITSPVVHQAVEFLLDHAPPSMHIALGTREDPPLALARWRVRSQITEIRESDLRFTEQEAETFLAQTMKLELPSQAVETLEQRTEGWIAGLQLAAIALQKETGQAEDFLAAFAGDHRYVMDYLVAEVLERLPESTCQFLLRTSILERLTAPLCDFVAERADSRMLLEQLESSNIFLIPMDARREWYRYHRLFAEFLQARLKPPEERRLHLRAAEWFESQGALSLAVRHAQTAGSLSGSYEQAERLIRLAAEEAIREGRIQTLLDWLNALPEDRVLRDPDLCADKGWALAVSGNFAQAETFAALAEQTAAQDVQAGPVLGKALLLRAFLALLGRQDYPETIGLAKDAIERLADQPQWLPMAYWILAEPYERMGNIAEAIRTLRQSKSVLASSAARPFSDIADFMLVYDLNLSGRRREALSLTCNILESRPVSSEQISPSTYLLQVRQAMLYYEANELLAAREIYDQAINLGMKSRLEPYLSFMRGLAAPLLFAQGDTQTALDSLRKGAELSRQTGLSDPGWFLAAEADMRLKRGDLEFAARWASEVGCSLEEEPQYLRLDTHLMFARLLLAQDRLEDAGRWLERVERFLDEHEIRRPFLTASILHALLWDRLGDAVGVARALCHALQYASPEGYVRAFLDEEERVLDLLATVRDSDPPFVDQLRSSRETGPSRPAVEFLPEPLSDREREILHLVAEGFSNARIATRLVIALATVKRHINNIYGKLGVNSRTQAVAKARRMGILK